MFTLVFFVTVPTAVRSFIVVFVDPLVKIILQLFDRLVETCSEADLTEFLKDGVVKAFADSIGLRTVGFRRRMINVLHH